MALTLEHRAESARRIKQARLDRGLTLHDVQRILGIPHQQWVRYESEPEEGKPNKSRSPDWLWLVQAAIKLGLDPETLFPELFPENSGRSA